MSKPRDAVSALPELPVEPFELAGTLARAKRGPYLTIVPQARPAPAPPAPPAVLPHAPNKSAREEREYFAIVTYPRVICISPGELFDELELRIVRPLVRPSQACVGSRCRSAGL